MCLKEEMHSSLYRGRFQFLALLSYFKLSQSLKQKTPQNLDNRLWPIVLTVSYI